MEHGRVPHLVHRSDGSGQRPFRRNYRRQLRFGRRSSPGLQPSATASAVTAAPTPLLHPARRLDHHPADLRRDRGALTQAVAAQANPEMITALQSAAAWRSFAAFWYASDSYHPRAAATDSNSSTTVWSPCQVPSIVSGLLSTARMLTPPIAAPAARP